MARLPFSSPTSSSTPSDRFRARATRAPLEVLRDPRLVAYLRDGAYATRGDDPDADDLDTVEAPLHRAFTSIEQVFDGMASTMGAGPRSTWTPRVTPLRTAAARGRVHADLGWFREILNGRFGPVALAEVAGALGALGGADHARDLHLRTMAGLLSDATRSAATGTPWFLEDLFSTMAALPVHHTFDDAAAEVLGTALAETGARMVAAIHEDGSEVALQVAAQRVNSGRDRLGNGRPAFDTALTAMVESALDQPPAWMATPRARATIARMLPAAHQSPADRAHAWLLVARAHSSGGDVYEVALQKALREAAQCLPDDVPAAGAASQEVREKQAGTATAALALLRPRIISHAQQGHDATVTRMLEHVPTVPRVELALETAQLLEQQGDLEAAARILRGAAAITVPGLDTTYGLGRAVQRAAAPLRTVLRHSTGNLPVRVLGAASGFAGRTPATPGEQLGVQVFQRWRHLAEAASKEGLGTTLQVVRRMPGTDWPVDPRHELLDHIARSAAGPRSGLPPHEAAAVFAGAVRAMHAGHQDAPTLARMLLLADRFPAEQRPTTLAAVNARSEAFASRARRDVPRTSGAEAASSAITLGPKTMRRPRTSRKRVVSSGSFLH